MAEICECGHSKERHAGNICTSIFCGCNKYRKSKYKKERKYPNKY